MYYPFHYPIFAFLQTKNETMNKTLRYEEDCTVHVEAANICLRNESNLPWIERCYIPLAKWEQVKTFIDEQIINRDPLTPVCVYEEYYEVFMYKSDVYFSNTNPYGTDESCTISIAKWGQVKQFIDEQIKNNNATK